MKRQSLFLVAIICTVFSLSSCAVDTSSPSWLNNTGWEADLAGYVLDGESISGSIRLYFKNGGYEFQAGYGQFNEAWGTYNNSFRTFPKPFRNTTFPNLCSLLTPAQARAPFQTPAFSQTTSKAFTSTASVCPARAAIRLRISTS